jgi:membrane-associated HD superfamily phosphohydrolase
MITTWHMYLLTRLDSIVISTVLLFILSCIIIGLSIINWKIEDDSEPEKYPKKTITIFSFILVISLLLSVVIPDTKTMALIYVIPKIINNEKVQKIPGKILDLANIKLDEWIKE